MKTKAYWKGFLDAWQLAIDTRLALHKKIKSIKVPIPTDYLDADQLNDHDRACSRIESLMTQIHGVNTVIHQMAKTWNHTEKTARKR